MYKDIKVQRKYQREWAAKKRAGLETKNFPERKRLTKEEVKKSTVISNARYRRYYGW